MLAVLTILTLISCTDSVSKGNNSSETELDGNPAVEESGKIPGSLINANGIIIQDRISVPDGYARMEVDVGSFGEYLRMLRLKPDGSKIMLYNGQTKDTDSHAAVLDVDIGDRDLQQCADAVIRLRAEYLYGQKLYDKIHFNFTSGFTADFAKWMGGKSIRVDGNDARWVNNTSSSGDYSSFRKYLNMVFAYAGTLSLSREMKKIPLEEMRSGDVFIKGATPGHAVIILDMAQNEKTGERIFIIAQSYMPAQEIHILKNLRREDISPWYSVDFGSKLMTPDWVFEDNQLMRFE
ncbi:MAG: hypothetical protein FIA99_16275 [Ruminiclostridium sp.]|nr:hypothetical protein [Ruminiclostridium sp.]